MGLSVGTKFGAYEVLEPIGSGAMGEDFRARDTKLNRDVALKVLPDLFADDPDSLSGQLAMGAFSRVGIAV